MDVYCEFVEGNSSKFWAVKQDGEKTTVRYGKIGKSGSTQAVPLRFFRMNDLEDLWEANECLV